MNSSESAARGPARLEEALAEYMRRVDRGEAVDRPRFLAEHPDLADDLAAYFALDDEVASLAGGEAVTRRGSGAPPAAPTRVDAPHHLPPGLLSAVPGGFGDYELLEELAAGGMGVVYRARQASLNRPVALKMILAGRFASGRERQRFVAEAEAAALLDHPNIVPVYEFGQHLGCYYLSMKLVEGGSLAGHAARLRARPREAARLLADVARAVHHAHQRGILHRDLKPANVLLEWPEGEDGRAVPYVSDFGLAKHLTVGDDLTRTGDLIGTPCYMAPEQAAGGKGLTTAADVYALGALLYDVLTGRPPFEGVSVLETLQMVRSQEPVRPRHLHAGLPRDLETICLKCLEKEPAKRYAGADELARDLGRFLAGEPIAARPVGPVERGLKWARRRPTAAALAAVVVAASLLLLGGGVWSYFTIRAARDRAVERSRQAREAADYMYTQVAEDWLANEPYLTDLQKEFLERSVRFNEQIARDEDTDPAGRREVALAYFRMGQIYRMLGRARDAEDNYGRAVTIQDELHTRFPDEPRYADDLASSYNWLGELHRTTGERDPTDAYRRAEDLQRDLFARRPDEPRYTQALARTLYNRGLLSHARNQLEDAARHLTEAVGLLEQVPQGARNSSVRHDLARAYLDLGLVLRTSGRLGDARDVTGQAAELLGELHDGARHVSGYRFELAMARQNLGNILSTQGELPGAEEKIASAVGSLDELVKDFPQFPAYRKELANAYNSHGAVAYRLSRRPDAAERPWGEAVRNWRELDSQFPNTAVYRGGLGMTVGNLGWLRLKQKRPADARRSLEEGLGYMADALRLSPGQPDFLDAAANQCRDLADAVTALGAREAGDRLADDLAAHFGGKYGHYFAARYYARCAVAGGSSTGPESCDKALRHLRRSVDEGFDDGRRLRDDPVFGPLKEHPAFRELLAPLAPPAAGR
jgi:tetratricopeptide (TPR) repeat protein